MSAEEELAEEGRRIAEHARRRFEAKLVTGSVPYIDLGPAAIVAELAPVDANEIREEARLVAAGTVFWSHIAQGHVRTGRRVVRRDR